MSAWPRKRGLAIRLVVLIGVLVASPALLQAQTGLRKVRVGIPSANVTYLPFIAAKEYGYYKDDGLEVEIVLMRPTLANTAVLTGDIDYNAAMTAVVAAAVNRRPVKAVIFMMRSPMQSLMAQKEFKDLRQLKGKKIGVTLGATLDLVARYILKRQGFEFGRDYSLVYIESESGRLSALELGLLDAAMFSVPENIEARQKGFTELAFSSDFIEFPQSGLGTSIKKIKESPEEVYRMVRATLRGLIFVSDRKNEEALLDSIIKNWAVKTRSMAGEIYKYLVRAMVPDASISMDGLQVLVDQQRESAKVTEPVNAAQVIDYSFVERARKDLGLTR